MTCTGASWLFESAWRCSSLLCAISWDATSLISFRALQGIGGGALFTTAFAIVANLYPPAERGRINGALGGVFGLSSVLGPLIGGFIPDSFSWPWIFLVNLPLGLIAVAFIVRMAEPQVGYRSR